MLRPQRENNRFATKSTRASVIERCMTADDVYQRGCGRLENIIIYPDELDWLFPIVISTSGCRSAMSASEACVAKSIFASTSESASRETSRPPLRSTSNTCIIVARRACITCRRAMSYTNVHVLYIYGRAARLLKCHKRRAMSMQHLVDLKTLDQQLALSIGGMAGIPTRDRRGNVLDPLWVKYSDESVVGMLLETNDIRKILLEQINEQLKARRDLIQEVEENEIVCKWLLDFTSSWEHEYSKTIRSRFDIGQLILSAMCETYFEIAPLLSRAKGFPQSGAHSFMIWSVEQAYKLLREKRKKARLETKQARDLIALADADKTRLFAIYASQDPASSRPRLEAAAEAEYAMLVKSQLLIVADNKDMCAGYVHTGDDAVIRFLFRFPSTRTLMCRVAGAILRKQEVCNRAGGYSAKVQRNDVSQQKNAALDTFCSWIIKNDSRLREILRVINDPEEMLKWIYDHKGGQKATDGNHYAHNPVSVAYDT